MITSPGVLKRAQEILQARGWIKTEHAGWRHPRNPDTTVNAFEALLFEYETLSMCGKTRRSVFQHGQESGIQEGDPVQVTITTEEPHKDIATLR